MASEPDGTLGAVKCQRGTRERALDVPHRLVTELSADEMLAEREGFEPSVGHPCAAPFLDIRRGFEGTYHIPITIHISLRASQTIPMGKDRGNQLDFCYLPSVLVTAVIALVFRPSRCPARRGRYRPGSSVHAKFLSHGRA
jgi:hypothetical protein